MPKWTPPANYTPHIYYDLFPTIIEFPNGSRHEKVRFILSAPPDPRIYVFKDGFTGPEAILIAEYDTDQIFGDTRDGFDLMITAPAPTPFMLKVRPHEHCGCGSGLKSFRPFTNMMHTSAPSPAGPLSASPLSAAQPAPVAP
jgi:hypothetical protein